MLRAVCAASHLAKVNTGFVSSLLSFPHLDCLRAIRIVFFQRAFLCQRSLQWFGGSNAPKSFGILQASSKSTEWLTEKIHKINHRLVNSAARFCLWADYSDARRTYPIRPQRRRRSPIKFPWIPPLMSVQWIFKIKRFLRPKYMQISCQF